MTRFLKIVTASLCAILLTASLYSQTSWQPKQPQLATRWTSKVGPNNALTEYPRPQLKRKDWQNLNGTWQYAITASNVNAPTQYDGHILVPYPVESALSGVKRPVQPTEVLWYKRSIHKPSLRNGEKVLLHFGAVDWQADIFLNGKKVGDHTGGYDQFTIDITSALNEGNNELVVKVSDPSDKGPNPHGKQVLKPESIWYTPATGIWQTVWMETVPAASISDLKITPDVDNSKLNIVVKAPDGYDVIVSAFDGARAVANGKGKSNTTIAVSIPSPKLWSPASPFLYDLKIQLQQDAKTIDEVTSYAGMRKVDIRKDAKGFERIFLNNQYLFNLGVLDQGFWPDGIYTAPTDEALRFDIEAIKAMGFNTIRKHIKREPDRWYYHCDKLGMIVWQDMINPSFDLTDEAKKIFETESKEHITELYNHPSIMVYTLFNEKWGQYDQARLTKWMKELDPTRLVNGHSGELLWVNEKLRSPSPDAWVASDLADIHSYPDPMNIPGDAGKGKVAVLGEFGGIGTFIPDHQWNTGSAWGYITVTPAALKAKYQVMNQHLSLLEKEGLAASIYTQPFDVEGEQNGLMTYDREVVKIPFEELRKIHNVVVATTKNIPRVTAKNADLAEPTQVYASLLQQYLDGKSNPAMLKKMAMMAAQTNDAAGKNRFSAAYIGTMASPYNEEDWAFIETSTTKTGDAGFKLIQQRLNSTADTTEFSSAAKRQLHIKLMNIIYQDVIAPYVPTPDAKPDWDEIAAKVNSFGAPGEEIFLRAKAIHTMNQGDWATYKPAATIYISKYGKYIKAEERTMFEKAISSN